MSISYEEILEVEKAPIGCNDMVDKAASISVERGLQVQSLKRERSELLDHRSVPLDCLVKVRSRRHEPPDLRSD